MLNALGSLWLYLSYLGSSFIEFLEIMVLDIFVRYGGYITAAIQELIFTPINGVGVATYIGLGLRLLDERFPVLDPLIAPAMDVLDQLTSYELSEKLKKLLNK